MSSGFCTFAQIFINDILQCHRTSHISQSSSASDVPFNKMVFLASMRVAVLVLLVNVQLVESFVLSRVHVKRVSRLKAHEQSRRDAIASAAAAALVAVMPKAAEAGIDPSALRNLPVEGDAGGSAMRLRQIDAGTSR